LRSRKILLSLAVTFILLLILASAASAQTQIEVPEVVSFSFGEQITFRAVTDTPAPASSASLAMQLPGSTEALVIPAEILPLDNQRSELLATFNPAGQKLPAFSTLSFHFEIAKPSGQIVASPEAQFQYTDNRFEWQTLPGERNRIHWYGGDSELARTVQEVADTAPQRMAELLDLTVPNPVDIYLYADTESLQAVLAETGHNWVAGRAEPEKGAILVAVPPGPDQQILVEQRIPHELMHIALFLTLGERYYNLPAWLNEGLATAAEQYPNPEYPVLIKDAYQETGLPQIATLCAGFPSEASSALLAYAQSSAFTRFILVRYGKSGLQSLVQAYANGQDCENGALLALGVRLSELEQIWRDETFGERLSIANQSNDFIPWMVIILATLGVPLLLAWVILRKKSSHGTERAQL
jgi:hypothetical protein